MTIEQAIEAAERDEQNAQERCRYMLSRRDYPEALAALMRAACASASRMTLKTPRATLSGDE